MRAVFVTHNEVGQACIEELHAIGVDVAAIFTRPEQEQLSDQVGLEDVARRVNACIHRVESVNEREQVQQITEYEPDLLFVVGWSQLVEQDVLEIPSVSALGMHPAPLPRGRGRAPIAWSLIKGLNETALTLFHLTEDADAGDIAGQNVIEIDRTDDAASIYQKIVKEARHLIREQIPEFQNDSIPRQPQDDSKATWWPRRQPNHGLIDWNQSADVIYNWIRGQTHPYPGAFSYIDGEQVTIWSANPPSGTKAFAPPGEILAVQRDTLVVAAWEEEIELTCVQLEDMKEISAAQLVESNDFEVGDRFANARDQLTSQ